MDASAQMRAFEEILDPLALSRTLDLSFVREVCERGIPDQPPWIRPRVWKLLLGSLPPEKDRWAAESRKARDRYYDLATEFLDEVERMPEPTYPLSQRDKLLDTIAKDVSRTQPRVPFFRSLVEPSPYNPLSPLPHGSIFKKGDAEDDEDDDDTPLPHRIDSAGALYERLQLIQASLRTSKHQRPVDTKTPEIRLSSGANGEDGQKAEDPSPPMDSLGITVTTPPAPVTPILSVTSPTSPTSMESLQSTKPSIELVSSQPLPKPVPKHSQVLLRILYLFSVTHPHQPYTQGLNELLAPLYYALSCDLDERESVHAEADAFWLFSELIGEVGAVVGEPGDWRAPEVNDLTVVTPGGAGAASNGVKGAMAELSHRLRWADLQLWEDLFRKSLDPKLPYYSYRWIACLLAQDLPLHSTLRIWDTIFAQPPSLPDDNPRISFLINICTSMLIRLRSRLIKTGNMTTQTGGLWGDEYIDADQVIAAKQGIQPATAHEAEGVMGEGFVEGMVLLQAYPIQTIGVDMIIQGARELSFRLKYEEEQRLRGPSAVVAVGSRLRDRIMNGITSRPPLEDVKEDEGSSGSSDDDEEGNTTEKENGKALPTLPPVNVLPSAAKLRQYAESLKDSDAAAQLSKASTNWKVAAIDAWKAAPSVPSPLTTAGLPNPAQTSRPPSVAGSNPPSSPTESTSSHQSKGSISGPASSKLWQYAEAFKSSDAAASLSKVSTNWTAAALDRWNKPVLSSPLNPTAPLPPDAPDDSGHSRKGSLSSWSGWGAVKAGSLWSGSRSGPLSPTSDSQALSPTWSPAQQASRDTRTSLPVPLRGREPPSSQIHRRSPSSSPGFNTPEKPAHFANPRDSFGGFPHPGDVPDPLQAALAKAIKAREDTQEDEGTSRLPKSLQSALASLSGNSRPPSPPLHTPKSAPRPLLLGTPAAKTVPSPSPKATPRPLDTRDSRPSSMSSNASAVSPASSTRSSMSTPRPSQIPPAVRSESPSPMRTEPERKATGGFVPLRNGVGRAAASATLMRKSRAAHGRLKNSDEPIPDVPPLPAGLLSPVSDTTPEPVHSPLVLDSPSIKKYSLTDGPAPAPLAPANDGYSSAGSSAAGPVPRARLRAKRNYQPKVNHALRVQTTEAPDELGLLHRREGGFSEGSLHPEGGMSNGNSPLTPVGGGIDVLKTPTSGDVDESKGLPRSPRRVKKVPSRERPKSAAVGSDGEEHADDEEDGYGDLLSAYSEDDAGGSRRSVVV